MTEPTRLSYEELAPLAKAIHLRETDLLAGLTLLAHPFPDCPNCGQPPTALAVNNDHPTHFLKDEVGFGFRPCGHNFIAAADDLYNATNAARREAENPLPEAP